MHDSNNTAFHNGKVATKASWKLCQNLQYLINLEQRTYVKFMKMCTHNTAFHKEQVTNKDKRFENDAQFAVLSAQLRMTKRTSKINKKFSECRKIHFFINLLNARTNNANKYYSYLLKSSTKMAAKFDWANYNSAVKKAKNFNHAHFNIYPAPFQEPYSWSSIFRDIVSVIIMVQQGTKECEASTGQKRAERAFFSLFRIPLCHDKYRPSSPATSSDAFSAHRSANPAQEKVKRGISFHLSTLFSRSISSGRISVTSARHCTVLNRANGNVYLRKWSIENIASEVALVAELEQKPADIPWAVLSVNQFWRYDHFHKFSHD